MNGIHVCRVFMKLKHITTVERIIGQALLKDESALWSVTTNQNIVAFLLWTR